MRLKYGVGVEVTESFRWAMYTSPQGYGLNAQTLPKALRYYLQPSRGRIFVGGDLSQAEARVVAYIARCKELIDLFNDPTRHVHSENAIAIFGHTVEKDSPDYTLAKSIVHASHYGEGPHRLSVQTGIPIKRTKQLLEAYHAKRPEIRQWHKQVWDRVKSTGSLANPFGETRVFYEAISCFSMIGKMLDTHWKDAIAWVPQSTVPHVVNLGILYMAELQHDGMDIQFHHQGHDSFLCSVPCGEEQRFFDLVHPKFAAIQLATPGGMFNIPTEYAVGFNFSDMVPYTGSCLPYAAWEKVVAAKLAKKPREQQILEGAYGAMLKDWRP